MGDRGNIVVTEEDGGKIYLYSHWTGSDLPGIVARALDRGRDRWGDEPYLTRILFSQMLMEGHGLEDTTGFGISTYEGDGGTTVHVNMKDQIVQWDDVILNFEDFATTHKG